MAHHQRCAGMGERGIGGSKCGSTGVVAIAFQDGSKTKLLAANVGDARAVLSRKGKALQLTIDHVPDRCAALPLYHAMNVACTVSCRTAICSECQ